MSRTWIFQGKPEIWDVVAATNRLDKFNWGVRQFKQDIAVGDLVYIWVSGQAAGIVAVARVITAPEFIADNEDELQHYPGGPPAKFKGKQLRVNLAVEKRVTPRIFRAQLLNHPILKELSIIKMPPGTNFAVSDRQARELESMVER
jgi:predicted RNA-binding protein with PUA-like domain